MTRRAEHTDWLTAERKAADLEDERTADRRLDGWRRNHQETSS